MAVGDLVQCFCDHSVWVFSFSGFLGKELACFFSSEDSLRILVARPLNVLLGWLELK